MRLSGMTAAVSAISLLACVSLRAAQVEVTAQTPFFAEADIASPVVSVAGGYATYESLEAQPLYVPASILTGGNWHPLMLATTLHRVQLGDREAWVSEALLYDLARRQVHPRPVPAASWQYAFVAVLCTLLIVLLFGWHRGYMQSLLRGEAAERPVLLTAAATIVLFRVTPLVLMAFLAGGVILHPTDEHSYFLAARILADASLAGTWQHTIGLSLLYLPLVILSGAESYHEIRLAMTLLNGLILAPAALLLGFVLLRRLGHSVRAAWIAALILALLPFFYFPVEYHGRVAVFKGIFSLPDFHLLSYRMYNIFHHAGWNGLSDVPAMVVMLGCLLLCMVLRPGRAYVIVIAALFAYGCLLRVTNIVFAPALAYLMWLRMASIYRHPRQVAGYVLLGIAAFLLIFSPQLLINKLQNGGIFKWPYVYHAAVDNTAFSFSYLKSGIHFLCSVNYLQLHLGLFGLLFIRDRHRRTVLALWGIPLVIFYAGFPVVGANAFRWLLTAHVALIGSFVLADVWRVGSLKARGALLVIFILNLLLISPTQRLAGIQPFGMSLETIRLLSIALPLVSLIIAAIFLRRDKLLLTAALVFLALWHSGSPFLLYGLLAALLVRALVEAILLSRQALKPSAPPHQELA